MRTAVLLGTLAGRARLRAGHGLPVEGTLLRFGPKEQLTPPRCTARRDTRLDVGTHGGGIRVFIGGEVRPGGRSRVPLHHTHAAAALAAAAAIIPLIPELPRQHVVTLPGDVRLTAIVAGAALLLMGISLARRHAAAWWICAGMLAAAAGDPAPQFGTSLGAVALLPAVALATLVVAAAAGTLQGTITSAYGSFIAVASAAVSIFLTRSGSRPDISVDVALMVLTATVLLMVAVRHRQRPRGGARLTLVTAQNEHAQTQIGACGDVGYTYAATLPSGAVVPLHALFSVGLVAGDPLTDEGRVSTAIGELADLCRQNGLVPCVYQARPALASAYRRAGFRMLKFGEEAIVDTSSFDLSKPQLANVRHEIARAARAHLTCSVWSGGDVPQTTWDQLEGVSWAWRRGRGEMGYSMRAVADLRRSLGLISIVSDERGTVCAFSSWHPLKDGWALDMMRRDPEAPAGAMDLCVATLIGQARETGARRVSLGAVPFRDLMDDYGDRRPGRPLRRVLYSLRLGGYRYDALARFKSKFGASWESRMIAVGGGLPGVPLSLLALVAVHRPAAATAPAKVAARPVAHGRTGTTRRHATPPPPRSRWQRVALILGVCAVVDSVVSLALKVFLSDWLFSEGVGLELTILIVSVCLAFLGAATTSALTGRPWLAATAAWVVFVATQTVPMALRARDLPTPPEVVATADVLGWISTLSAALVMAALASSFGGLVGAALRRQTGVMIRAAAPPRSRWIVASVATVAVIAGSLSGTGRILSQGPFIGMYTYSAASAIPHGSITTLMTGGGKVLLYEPALHAQSPQVALPTLYFLHGQPGGAEDWLSAGADLPGILDQLIATHAIPPVYAVMPDASTDRQPDGAWANSALGPANEDWLMNQVMPAVHREVAVVDACTGIGGYSEGGFGAINLALRHPDVFHWAASYSGYFDADSVVFGPAAEANSPTWLAPHLRPDQRMTIFLGAGTIDPFLGPTRAFSAELATLHWPVGSAEVTGPT